MYASFLGNGRPSAVLCKNLATIHMQDGLCGYGYIHSYPRKICAYGEISYPRQACLRTTTSVTIHGTFVLGNFRPLELILFPDTDNY